MKNKRWSQPHTLISNKMAMVFNATFNNISVISRRSDLLVEETGESRENHRPVSSHRQTLSLNVVMSAPHHQPNSNTQHSQKPFDIYKPYHVQMLLG